jgi:Ca2+-binding RTX toxin-like protein
MRLARIWSLTIGLLVACAASASAAVTVSVTNGVMTVQGDSNDNNIIVTIAGANYSVSGATAAGANCAGAGPVTCPMALVSSIDAPLLTGSDVWDSDGINIPTTVDLAEAYASSIFFQRARTGNAADTVLGGPHYESDIVTQGGNDTIRLFGGDDATQVGFFSGGFGTVLGGAGDDTIDLGDGNDGGVFGAFIDPGPGGDVVDAGPGNDRNVSDQGFPDSGNDTILGGPGDDIDLDGGGGDDLIDGGSGNDATLFGNVGADTVRGGPDDDVMSTYVDLFNDVVEGGPGDDTTTIDWVGIGIGEPDNSDSVAGGPGRDVVNALNVHAPAIFTADGVADDGYANAPRTANILPDNEVLVGTPDPDTLGGGPGTLEIRGLDGEDTITAGSAPATLIGGDGGDLLTGGPAADVLFGVAGDDTLNGNDGDDMMDGGTGGDAINGGNGSDTGDWSTANSPVTLTPGDAVPDGEIGEGDILGGDVENLFGGAFNDTIVGAPGPSLLSSGGGDDNVSANDGAADDVLCGAGNDTVTGDPEDYVEATGAERCEHVTDLATLLGLGAKKKVDKKGRAKLKVSCPAAGEACTGDVGLLDKKGQPISGMVPFGVAPGQTANVQVKLDKDALRTLEKKNKLTAQILAELDVENGLFQKVLQQVKLKD